MSLKRPGNGPLANVPDRLDDGSRLVGVAADGTPVYFDPEREVFRDRDRDETRGGDRGRGGTRERDGPDGATTSRDLDGESVAEAIAAVERSRGWTVLSEYGLAALSNG